MINIEIANALSGYIETLYNLNCKLLKLCGTDVFNGVNDNPKLILEVLSEIPRLIPYIRNKKNQKLEIKKEDGLLEFSNELQFLDEDYNNILIQHYDLLGNIKNIRNKYEHKLHKVKIITSGNGSICLFDFEFFVEGENIYIHADACINLIKDLNKLFSKIVKEIKNYANANEKTGYAYYKRMQRFDFLDFNKIYDSNLIRIVGIVMNEY